MYESVGILYDTFIVPWVAINFGLLDSLCIIFAITLAIDYLLLLLYDYRKIDFLCIEYRKFKSPKITFKDIPFVLFLAVREGPCATALYFRKGSYLWNGIPDHLTFSIFITGTFFCSMAWTIGFEALFYFVF